MKEGALTLIIVLISLCPYAGNGQDLPDAEILTADDAWCELSDNLRVAEILITGEIATSRFDLIMGIRGTRDTLVDLPSGIFNLYFNNQLGRNEYIIFKIIEYQESQTLENDVDDTLVMEVHAWPDMTLTTEAESQCSPAEYIFTARPGYASYIWDFGDGTDTITSTNQISHTYSSEEEVAEFIFPIGLKIETDFGCKDSLTDQLTMYPAPLADFQASPELLFYPNTTVTLTNTTSPGDWDFLWEFGDASRNYTRDPGEHVYQSWGVYDIEMQWSTPSCTGSVIKQIEIRPPPPEADFSSDTAGCSPLVIHFSNNTLYGESYLWDFDDGTYSTDANPVHTFHEDGTHQVKLVATGLSGKDSIEQVISVHERPDAIFEPSTTQIIGRDELINFYNSTMGATTYLWDFGDGNSSEVESPGHSYSNAGNYTVSLFAWNNEGCADTLVRENLVSVMSDEGSVVFPNAFRWNGSGPTGGYWIPGSLDNTVFHPDIESAVEMRMVIFTRHGHRVFESNEIYVGWDGYINDSELAVQGVYVYKAWVTYAGGEQEILAGDVTFVH